MTSTSLSCEQLQSETLGTDYLSYECQAKIAPAIVPVLNNKLDPILTNQIQTIVGSLSKLISDDTAPLQ